MEPVLALDAPTVRVEPGGERRVRLEVRNPGPDVERYRLDVLGEAARWSQVEPRHVEVPPGPQSQVVEVVFRPPQAATAPTRDIPFGVRAQSLQHRDRAGVVEGDLVVSAVREVRARIEPTAATGRWGAGFRVVLDNEGRSPVTVAVAGSDTRAALRFAVSPAAPQVPPGGTATALVSVRLRRPRLVGGQVQHPFGVEYRGDGDPSAGRLPAALTQRAVLPVAVAVLLALLVLAAAGLGVSLLVRGLADGPGPGAGPAAGPGGGPGAGDRRGPRRPGQRLPRDLRPADPGGRHGQQGGDGALRGARSRPRASTRASWTAAPPTSSTTGSPGSSWCCGTASRTAPAPRPSARRTATSPPAASSWHPGSGMEGYGLGVDLGTTYTAAAIWRAGRAESVPLGVRAHTVPSVLFLREDGVLLVGEAAARRGVTEPERVAREFKRWFGDGIPVFLGDREIPAEDLTGQMLRWVVETVTQREGGPPAHVTLTHPATWGGHRTGLLVTAAEHAGLSDVGLLAEPVAAAAYHASTQRLQPGRVLVVYDLGGGTFDVTVVRKTPGGFAVAGEPCGDDALGGADFDQVVMSHVATTVGPPWQALDLEDEGVLAALARVREDAVAAKEMLSADVDASVPVLLPGVTRDVRITRGEFEAAIRIPLLRTVDLLAQAIEGAGVEAGEVQAVLLVGGSSRIPLVSRLIATELRLPVALDAHPKYAICLGAAIAAGARLAPAAPAPSGWAPPPGGPPGYRSPPPVPWGPAPTGRPAPHPGTRPGMPAAHPGTARPVPGPPPQQPTRRPTPRPLPRPAPGPGGPQRPGTLPPAGPPAGPPGGPPAGPPPAARPGTPPARPAPRPAAGPAPARPSLPAPTVHRAPPRRAPRPAPPVVGAEPPAAVVVDLRGTGISGTVDTAVATTPERPSWAPVLTARDEPVTVTHVADRGRGRRTAVVTVAVALVVVALVTVGALLLPATRQVLTGGRRHPAGTRCPRPRPRGAGHALRPAGHLRCRRPDERGHRRRRRRGRGRRFRRRRPAPGLALDGRRGLGARRGERPVGHSGRRYERRHAGTRHAR